MKHITTYPWLTMIWATCCLFMALLALVFADTYCAGKLLPHPPTENEKSMAWFTAFGFVVQALGWFWVARERVDMYRKKLEDPDYEKEA